MSFRSLVSRLSALFRRRELDARADEELHFLVRMQAEENLKRGMQPQEAWRAARNKAGNLARVSEEVRRMNTIAFLDESAGNVRFSLRTMRRNPGFAITAVLVLALGLGASTAMFSALDRILFRPLPYGDADRLVNVGMDAPAIGRPGESDANLHSVVYQTHWKPALEPFAAVTTVQESGDTCDVTGQQPERLLCANVESNFLQTFGVRPALGRDFTPEDDVRGAPPVAIVSHEVWTRRFSSSPDAIGRNMDIDGKPVQVIGVLPAGFAIPGGQADVVRPQQIYPDPSPRFILEAFARLKPGITPEQAQSMIAPVVEASAEAMGRTKGTSLPRVTPLRDFLVGDAARVGWLLLGAVAGLLLIACVNVANLILARLAARTREFAVRSALGAGRARLARLAVTESLLLAVAGGGLGLLFAAALLRVFVQLAPSSIPEVDRASLDLRVFAVAAVLALAAGAAVGIWPAFAVLRSRALQYGPRATAAPRPRLRFSLVTVQIALTVGMLGGSALLLRSLWNLVAVPLGYHSQRIVTMSVTPNVAHYPARSRGAFFERLLDRIHNIPGAPPSAMSSAAAPTGVTLLSGTLAVKGQTRNGRGFIRVRAVTPGYFETFGIPIVRGRAFVDADRTAHLMAILSESAARSLSPSKDPVGNSVRVPIGNEWAEVVGIASDIRNTGLTQTPDPELYLLWRRDAAAISAFSSTAYFAIRTQGGTTAAMGVLKQAAADIDPQLPVTIEPLEDRVARLTERPRFVAWLLAAFAGLALVLAAAGLYGVASYLVTQRTRDIGVRIALGATPTGISKQVVREAGRWVIAGAVLGCALAYAGVRAIEAQLFNVSSRDPVSWIAALGVLGIALLLAVLRPAMRAARVDPMEALRAD